MSKSDVYYYTGPNEVVFITAWEADPLGGPAIQKTTYSVAHGEGIDISILGFSKEKPQSPSAEENEG